MKGEEVPMGSITHGPVQVVVLGIDVRGKCLIFQVENPVVANFACRAER